MLISTSIMGLRRYLRAFSLACITVLALAACDGDVQLRPLNFTGVGIDYDIEARCADDNWATTTPVACNPQLAFTCDTSDKLDFCPSRCQSCYDSDLDYMKNELQVGAITIYQPNYYVLKAAQKNKVKVILGTFNDTVKGLATPATQTDCTYAGSPLPLCGTKYADALFDGACGGQTPWDPAQFCEAAGAYITAFDEFFADGTVIGIQLGNEVLSSSDPVLTKSDVTAAAKAMREALDTRSYPHIPIIVSLVAGNEKVFCENGAPPANVDYIAAHPYCNYVASVPPSWPLTGSSCLAQVQTIYEDTAIKYCGVTNVFIGETGYNTGCPTQSDEATHITQAKDFIGDMVKWMCKTDTQPVVDPPFALFLFAFVDACPESGCAPGCSGSVDEGNGYFGLFHTKGYLTKGALVNKFNPTPSLICQ